MPTKYDCGNMLPSNEYIELTLGVSGASYIAPANGWVYASSDGIVNFKLYNNKYGIMITGASGWSPTGYIPVKKGEIFYFLYSSNSNNKIRFIYVEGQLSIIKY